MAQEQQTIRVNFGRVLPIFPLQGVVLMPHAVVPLHVFEPRYRQMVNDALDGAGQIAMALIDDAITRTGQDCSCAGTAAIRPAVCVGQIVQHERLPDGRFNILLQGVCRARVVKEIAPDDEVLYRRAKMAPITPARVEDDMIPGVRSRLRNLLGEGPLTRLTAAEGIAGCLSSDDAPTGALLELITMSIVSDTELRYRLLEEANPLTRAGIIEDELLSLRTLISRAEGQLNNDLPKGVTWN